MGDANGNSALAGQRQPQQQARRAGGLTDPVPYAAALAWTDAQAVPSEAELVPLADAPGRVLAAPAVAAGDMPGFDRAGIDGIALAAEATVGASAYNPLRFRLVPAGSSLPPDSAARVAAGDALPAGADAVIPPDALDGAAGCEIVEPVAPGSGVERRAGQAAAGATLLAAGRRLRAADIGLLAVAGIERVPVVGRPLLRVLLTGASAGVPDADGPLLRGLIERDGGVPADIRPLARDREALAAALAAPGADIILVAGGTGRGGDDHAAAALAEAGELAIHGVALYPAETAGMGRSRAGTPVFLLPGAPASCLWAYEMLAGRAVRRMAGRAAALPWRRREMTLRLKLVSRIGTTEICPVRSIDDDSVEPTASFAEAGLVAAARADGVVIVAEGSEGFAAGARVTVHLQGAEP